MAPRGPKPIPTQVKLVTGTARAHRLNPQEPMPMPEVPEPPDHLNEDARAEWARIADELSALGILTRLDRGSLAAYCQAYGRWRQAEQALARMAERDATTDGLMIRTKSGNLIQNPLVGSANKAMADMMRYAAEFGLTPSARSRVEGLSPDAGWSPADEFLA
ncbi:phage terminase small subunit P27 family [Oceanicola sp. D3]|nr:phage terminase small subunit P27 family [Oceanicola sp. D3]